MLAAGVNFAHAVIPLVLSCVVQARATASEAAPAVVPLPKSIQAATGNFVITAETRIRADKGAKPAAELLAQRLRTSTGHPFPVRTGARVRETDGAITLLVDKTGDWSSPEGYSLSASPRRVVIRGATPAGLFYGTQTLLQLLPPEALSREPRGLTGLAMPAVEIRDEPAFEWRGFLFDVARHFFTKQEIMKLIDVMALHKLNRLQLHLTDDQGWRLEIRKYPELTKTAGWRKQIGFGLDPASSTAYGPDGRYGGFLSGSDVRELVAYAAARHILIVPEIEMPGHASGALSVFPQLSCAGGPYDRDMGGGVFAGVYCAGNEQTYEFLEDVLAEVMRLFPGEYIHIGGDEVPKANWKQCARCQALMKREGLKNENELQGYFVRRIEGFIRGRGRTLVGWSEIREGGLARNALLMDWIGGGLEAARSGHDVVMTPTTFCYLDYYQSTNHASEPRAIGGYIPLSKTYSFRPVPDGLEPERRRHILGVQGNLWTEYIASLRHAEYMAFPRLSALAEVAWTPGDRRDYPDFLRRLEQMNLRLDQLGVNYRRTVPGKDE